jgi:hypothetical protein
LTALNILGIRVLWEYRMPLRLSRPLERVFCQSLFMPGLTWPSIPLGPEGTCRTNRPLGIVFAFFVQTARNAVCHHHRLGGVRLDQGKYDVTNGSAIWTTSA